MIVGTTIHPLGKDATRFPPILIGWHPHPDCRYRDGDGSFCSLPTKMTCTAERWAAGKTWKIPAIPQFQEEIELVSEVLETESQEQEEN